MLSVSNVVKASSLGAIGYALFSFCANGVAIAQTGEPAQGAPAATLPPVVVESPRAKRTKPKASLNASRDRAGARTVRTAGRGNGSSAAAGAGGGTRRAESAWGHVDGYVATRS